MKNLLFKNVDRKKSEKTFVFSCFFLSRNENGAEPKGESEPKGERTIAIFSSFFPSLRFAKLRSTLFHSSLFWGPFPKT